MTARTWHQVPNSPMIDPGNHKTCFNTGIDGVDTLEVWTYHDQTAGTIWVACAESGDVWYDDDGTEPVEGYASSPVRSVAIDKAVRVLRRNEIEVVSPEPNTGY